ncbi:hypothetical protein niasHS_002041 [Heterodera schachtii]|uniref:B30.2/SPRY domain-containing protein n=1 Tax=Heterodera schachtii TaxID=97005 RepID=A0ABD2K5N6_HETSC
MATFSVALLSILIGFRLSACFIRNEFSLISSLLSSSRLEQQIKNGIRENQNLIVEKMSEIGAKLEQIENGMRDNQNLLSNKLDKDLFHIPLPIYYRWNASADCHPKIVINESTNAIQRNATGTEEFLGGHINGIPLFRSFRAVPIQMPSAAAAGRIGIIYAEYRIVADKGPLLIGLSTKQMTLCNWIGNGRVSYGYANYGTILSKNANGNVLRISADVPSFRTGAVVGCGLNWATRQVFFTNNGQRLNIANLYVDEGTAELYPTVSLSRHGDTVEANFGPNFKYDLFKEF